jgi:hypothetical protein
MPSHIAHLAESLTEALATQTEVGWGTNSEEARETRALADLTVQLQTTVGMRVRGSGVSFAGAVLDTEDIAQVYDKSTACQCKGHHHPDDEERCDRDGDGPMGLCPCGNPPIAVADDRSVVAEAMARENDAERRRRSGK